MMKYRFEILILFFSWSLFLVWEFMVQRWAESQPAGGGAVIRVDLIVTLPILIAATAWSVMVMIKKHRNEKK